MNGRVQSTAVVATIVLLLLAVAYIGGEGAFYLVSGYDHFPEDTAYRRLYAQLDALSDLFPELYWYREELAEKWLEYGEGSDRLIFVGPEYPDIQVIE